MIDVGNGDVSVDDGNIITYISSSLTVLLLRVILTGASLTSITLTTIRPFTRPWGVPESIPSITRV